MIRCKSVKAFLLAACVAGMLTGCGNQNKKQQETETQAENATEENVNKSATSSLFQSLNMQNDVWQESIAVGMENLDTVQIDVQVELPDTDHMCVVDMEKKDVTSLGVKTLIEKMFDDDRVGVFEKERYPKWKLEQLVMEYESAVQLNEQNGEEEEYANETKRKLNEYKNQLTDATNDLIEPEDYTSGTFWGMIDGRAWTFYVSKYYYEDGYSLWGEMGDYAEALSGKTDLSGCALSPSDIDGSRENACTLSEEEAVRQAEEYLNMLGYDEYTLKKVSELFWNAYSYQDNTEENFTEGYTVYFGRTVDGVQISTDTAMYVTGMYVPMEMDENQIPMTKFTDEIAWVRVTDAGVVSFCVQAPCSVKAESRTETSLLSFDRIQGCIRDAIGRHAETNAFCLDGTTVKFNAMDLVYMVLTDDGLTVIPAWRLYHTTSDGMIDNYILVNAIDGSEIDFMSEYYQMIDIDEEE